jgi:hypothetical protein
MVEVQSQLAIHGVTYEWLHKAHTNLAPVKHLVLTTIQQVDSESIFQFETSDRIRLCKELLKLQTNPGFQSDAAHAVG